MSQRYYTEDHEWIQLEGDVVTVGISAHAVDELGEIVFVELPEIGRHFGKGDEFASVESVKTVSGIYTPIDGDVIEANDLVVESPELINHSPYDTGWLVRLKCSGSTSTDDLMDETAYQAYLTTI